MTDEEYEELCKANKIKIDEIRKLNPSYDMAFKLGSLQARAKFAMTHLRMASNMVKNRYIKKMLRKEANEIRKFLVDECEMDISFDARYDV